MFQTLPGFREFYPEDCAIRNYLFETWRASAQCFGFAEFDGPLLEPLELITAKSGDEIVSQLFNFEDKGGRLVTLRPELTPTLARLVGAKAGSLKRPVKWFGIAENFRYEKPQKGRLRSHYQLNADLLGDTSPAADAEIIALLIQTLCAFGLGQEHFVLRLSDRELWLLLLALRGIEGEPALLALNAIDKMERESEEAVVKALTDNGLADAESLYAESLSLVACQSLPEVEAFFQERAGSDAVILERVSQRLKQWHELLAALRAMGLEDFIRVDMGIVRGLAYYTGFVFEAFQTVGKGRALAGGGRYDHLVEKLGYASMPAVGFGMGDVTLRLLLEELKLLPEKAAKLDAYVIIGGPAERETALRDIARLRQQGVKIDYPFKQQGFGKQFKTADQSNAEFALIYGAEELASGIVKVKKLDQGSETIVKREDLHKLFNVS